MKKHFISFMAVMAAIAVVLVSCDRHADPSTPEVSMDPANCHIVSTPERAQRMLEEIQSDHLQIILDAVNLIGPDAVERKGISPKR